MRKGLSILFGLGLLASFCHAEARWCSIIGRGPNDTLFYPPIALAAQVQGIVLSRIYYLPNGQVKDIDAISGPAMLLDALKKEMMEWTIKTDATGKALCETLVIAEFRLHVPDKPTQERSKTEIIPSILRLTIEPIDHGTVTTYLVSIPAGSNSLIISKNHFKRAISRIFAHRS